MIETELQSLVLHRIDEVRRLCPEMRLGQIMCALGLLGEDATGRSLYDLEDEALLAALDRFAEDLNRRTQT